MSFGISGATWFAIAAASASAYSSYESGQASNRANDRAKDNARRRYEFEAGISQNQMEEQKQIATEKMTDVTRAFLKAKGTAKAMQAESGVGGNVQQIAQANMRLKESETKGKVAQEIDTNVINIAQGMLANKIDTDALVREALSRKKSGIQLLTDAGLAGASGYLSASSLTSGMKGLDGTIKFPTTYSPTSSSNMTSTRTAFSNAFNS